MSRQQHMLDIIVIMLMGLFLYSATAKLMDFWAFAGQLSKSPFLQGYAGGLSYVVPASEIMVAVLLMVPRTRQAALYTYLYMMASFTFYVYLMMHKAHYLPCACMGIFGTALSWDQHLVVNLLLTLLTFTAIMLYKPRSTTQRQLGIERTT